MNCAHSTDVVVIVFDALALNLIKFARFGFWFPCNLCAKVGAHQTGCVAHLIQRHKRDLSIYHLGFVCYYFCRCIYVYIRYLQIIRYCNYPSIFIIIISRCEKLSAVFCFYQKAHMKSLVNVIFVGRSWENTNIELENQTLHFFYRSEQFSSFTLDLQKENVWAFRLKINFILSGQKINAHRSVYRIVQIIWFAHISHSFAKLQKST